MKATIDFPTQAKTQEQKPKLNEYELDLQRKRRAQFAWFREEHYIPEVTWRLGMQTWERVRNCHWFVGCDVRDDEFRGCLRYVIGALHPQNDDAFAEALRDQIDAMFTWETKAV